MFHHPVRTHFDLESMWSDAPRVALDLPPEVMDTSGIEDVFAPRPAARPEYHGDARFGGFEDEFVADDEWDDDGHDHDDDDDARDDDDHDALDEDAPPA